MIDSRLTGLLAGCGFIVLWITSPALSQTPAVTLRLAPDQIGVIKTAPAIATRLVFDGPALEIVCGDLFDSATGRGGFVVQRSGNDVFIKPVVAKGMSNLFVKTGPGDRHVYGFDLVVGSLEAAYRIVYVFKSGSEEHTRGTNGRSYGNIPSPPLIQPIDTLNLGVFRQMGQASAELLVLPGVLAPAPGAPPPPYIKPSNENANGDQNAATRLGSATKRIIPIYPRAFEVAGASGPVVVEVTVDNEGDVIAAKALSGHTLLRDLAVEAARRWKFKPAVLRGIPTRAVGTIVFNFQPRENVSSSNAVRTDRKPD